MNLNIDQKNKIKNKQNSDNEQYSMRRGIIKLLSRQFEKTD